MRHNSVVIESTHGFIHFRQLTMQVKSTANEMNAKTQAIFNPDSIKKPTMTTRNITEIVDY